MAGKLIGGVGSKAIQGAALHSARGGGFLDIRYGFKLLMSRSVPVTCKALALGIGAFLAFILIALEMPFESIVAGLLNLLGIGLDVIFDGLEFIAGPILFASMLMPRIYRPVDSSEYRREKQSAIE